MCGKNIDKKMSDSDDTASQIDSIYKGLLDRFHPAARSLVSAGKAYLKALQHASSCGQAYHEAVNKLTNTNSDTGSALQQLVTVYKDIHLLEAKTLKAFQSDLLTPLEANIDKDTKQVHAQLKRFSTTYKRLKENHSKASAVVKRNRKKGRSRSAGVDKQIKHYQTLEECKGRLDQHLSQSLQTAQHEQRRRVGFVLERHCSLSRHHLALFSRGSAMLTSRLSDWQEVAASRDKLPPDPNPLPNFQKKQDMREENVESPYALYSSPSIEMCELEQRKRRARSCELNERAQLERGMGRARSNVDVTSPRAIHRGFISTDGLNRDSPPFSPGGRVTALYPYNGSAPTQLSFREGDNIMLIGDRSAGWQYGENSQTGRRGWFPVAYTEELLDSGEDSALGNRDVASSLTGSSNTMPNTMPRSGRAIAGNSMVGITVTPVTPNTERKITTRYPQASNQVTSTIAKILQHSKRQHVYSREKLNDRDFRTSTQTSNFSTNGESFSLSPSTSMTDGLAPPSYYNGSPSTSMTDSLAIPSYYNGSPQPISFSSSNDSGFSNEDSKQTQLYSFIQTHTPKSQSCLSLSSASQKKKVVGRRALRSYSWGRKPEPMVDKVEYSDCGYYNCEFDENKKDQNTPPSTLSPSAKKILALRNNKKNKKGGSLKRSKSLLCLGFGSSNREPMQEKKGLNESKDWYHKSIVKVDGDLPDPPDMRPPSPPCVDCMQQSCTSSCTYYGNLSSGGKVAMKPCKIKKRPPMPLPNEIEKIKKLNESSYYNSEINLSSICARNIEQEVEDEKSENSFHRRNSKRVARSSTWTSPKSYDTMDINSITDALQTLNAWNVTRKPSNSKPYGEMQVINPRILQSIGEENDRFTSNTIPHPGHRKKLAGYKKDSSKFHQPAYANESRDFDKSSRAMTLNRSSNVSKSDVNILNYTSFIENRLKDPDGAQVLNEDFEQGRDNYGSWNDLWNRQVMSCIEI